MNQFGVCIRACACVFAQTIPVIFRRECAQVLFAYEGEFIIEAEYSETFDQGKHAVSYNLLIP